jgi:hypothetical protein
MWVIGSLAVSIASGIGVYLVIKDQRAAAAEAARNESIAEPPPPRPAPSPVPEDPIAPTEVVAEPPPVPADRAEAGAVDPTTGMFGTPGIDGAIDQELVVQAVRATELKLTRCFADTAPRGGVVRVMLMINRRGGVTTVAASGVNDAVDRCIEGVLRPVRFGRTTDGNPAKIVFPIAFDGTLGGTETGMGCDEVACVLDNYEPPCCAKFRRGAPSEPTLQESPSREELARELRSISSAITACARDADFIGTMKLRVTIRPDGSVQEATVNNAAPELAACVARAARRLTFTASQSGAKVSFPYSVQ